MSERLKWLSKILRPGVKRPTPDIDPFDPNLSVDQVKKLPPFGQLIHGCANDFHSEGKDPQKFKAKILRRAKEAASNWMAQ